MNNPLDELIKILPEIGKINLERTEKGNLVILLTQTGEKYFLIIEEPAPSSGQASKATLFGKIPDQEKTSFKDVSVLSPGPEADPELPTEFKFILPDGKQINTGSLVKTAIIPPSLFLQKCESECPPNKTPQEAIASFLNQYFS